PTCAADLSLPSGCMEKICIRMHSSTGKQEVVPDAVGRKVFAGPQKASGSLCVGLSTFVTVVFTVLLSFIGGVAFTALPTYVPTTVAVLPTFLTVTVAVFTGTNAGRPDT